MFQADDQVAQFLTTNLSVVCKGHLHPIDVVIQSDTNIGEASLRIAKALREVFDFFPEPLRLFMPAAVHPEVE